jgi:hypothetical protein
MHPDIGRGDDEKKNRNGHDDGRGEVFHHGGVILFRFEFPTRSAARDRAAVGRSAVARPPPTQVECLSRFWRWREWAAKAQVLSEFCILAII